MSGKEGLSLSNDKENGAKKSDEKLKQPIGNRLFKPTAASVAKSKQAVTATTVKGKPGLAPGPLRKSIKHPPGTSLTVQKPKSVLGTAAKKPNSSIDASKKNTSKQSPKDTTPDQVKDVSTEKTAAESSNEASAAAGRSRQDRPDKLGLEEKRDQTPDTSVLPPKRGVSTPTGEDAGSQTILDSWDASQIVGVNKTQVPAGLNETMADPCVSLREKFLMPKPAFPAKTSSTVRKPMLQASKKLRKPSCPATISKGGNATILEGNNTIMESEDSDFEKLMEQAYQRYIQSLFMKHVTNEADKKITKECNEKLIASWRLLEEERQIVLKKQEQLEEANLIADLQAVLKTLAPYLQELPGENEETVDNLSNLVDNTLQRLKSLAQSLDHIKHNVEIKGIAINRETSQEIAQELMSKFQDFTKRVKSGALFTTEMEEGIQLLKGFKEEVQCIQANTRRCEEMVEKCRRLATKEASLNISLNMAKEVMPEFPNQQNEAQTESIDVNMVEADAANHSSEGANEEENKDFTVNLVQSFDGLAIDETPAMV